MASETTKTLKSLLNDIQSVSLPVLDRLLLQLIVMELFSEALLKERLLQLAIDQDYRSIAPLAAKLDNARSLSQLSTMKGMLFEHCSEDTLVRIIDGVGFTSPYTWKGDMVVPREVLPDLKGRRVKRTHERSHFAKLLGATIE